MGIVHEGRVSTIKRPRRGAHSDGATVALTAQILQKSNFGIASLSSSTAWHHFHALFRGRQGYWESPRPCRTSISGSLQATALRSSELKRHGRISSPNIAKKRGAQDMASILEPFCYIQTSYLHCLLRRYFLETSARRSEELKVRS